MVLAAAPLAAQDPSLREIQEIARRVDEQLREIDRLLLESAKARGDSGAKPPELLQQSRQQSEVVEQGIDELIEKLTQMKNRSQSGGSSGDQQQQPQDGQQQQGQQDPQQGGNRPRRENPMEDFVDQSQQQGQQQQQQQQGQQQDQQQQGAKPQDGEVNPEGGENRPPTQLPDNETAPGQPGTGEGEWGKLQSYVNQLKNRGSPPKVPEKYRKYWEAYLKSTGDGR